jgi:hypothetical protein
MMALRGLTNVMDSAHTRRTYIYYSDEKILALKDEVPPPRWTRALGRVNKIGATVLGSGGEISIGPPSSEPILQTLQAVWVDLADEGEIGTFDDPAKRYFYGTLTFYYGLFKLVDPPVFFLVGATDKTIVALGGAWKHVRGFRGRDEIPIPDEGAQPVVVEPDVATVLYESSGASTEIEALTGNDDIRAIHVAGLYHNWKFWKGKKLEFEVLARKELRSSVSPPSIESPTDVLIGSPVFVALT